MSRARPPSTAPRHLAPPPRLSRGGTLLGVFIGILLGALVAAGAAWYFTRKNPFITDTAPQPQPVRPMPGEAPPLPLPGKPGDRPVEKPQFDFYKILPQGDAPAPGTPTSEAPKPPPTTLATPIPNGEKLYLQAGAFESATEADNLKARLALMGIEASSLRGEVPDRGVMHRVRIGPFSAPEQMNAVRARLAEAGINATVVRVKP